MKIFYCDLRFDAPPAQIMTIKKRAFKEILREITGLPIICRKATADDKDEVRRLELKHKFNAYKQEIAQKYGTAPEWPDNRWFVEQIRPTL